MGDDTLTGGAGKDRLTGGKGKKFRFEERPKSGEFDTITDFKPVDDTLRFKLSSLNVKTLKKGSLPKKFFTVGNDSKADDLNDFIVYNKKNGMVYLDGDGSGSKIKPLAIVKVTPGTKLAAGDFEFF